MGRVKLRYVAIAISLLLHFVLGASAARVSERRRKHRATAVAVVEKEKKKADKPKPKPPEPPPPKVAALEKPKVIAPKVVEAPKQVDETPKQVASSEGPKDIGAYDPNSTVVMPDNHQQDTKLPDKQPDETPKPKAVVPPKPKGDDHPKPEKGGDAPCTEAPSKPEPTAKTEIEYTDQARQEGVEGRLVLKVTVDANGAVTDVVVVSSVDPSLDAAAIAAVKQWRFKPAMACGKPVAGGTYTLARRFELGD